MPKADATGLAPKKSADLLEPSSTFTGVGGFSLFASSATISLVRSWSGGLGHSNATSARRASLFPLPSNDHHQQAKKPANSTENKVRISRGKIVTRYSKRTLVEVCPRA